MTCMLELEPRPSAKPLQRPLLALLAASLTFLCVWVLAPFLSSIAWAAILAYISWPAYRLVRKPFGRSPDAAALVMLLLVTCLLLVPLLWLVFLVRDEFMSSFPLIASSLSEGVHAVVEGMRRIPWLGAPLQDELNRYVADPATLGRDSVSMLQSWVGALASFLAALGRNLARILLTLLILFFFYRGGDEMAQELRRAAKRLFVGGGHVRYLRAAGAITRAVFFGILLSAAAQGVIAAIGYRLAGLRAPALLGALTAVLSVVPLIGTAFVWLPVAIGFMVAGAWGKGVFLLAWGTLLVHPTDNLLRPLLVSNAARLPFLLVALGAIGGISAFGLIGAFAGPVLLGIALELWREWTNDPERSLSRG